MDLQEMIEAKKKQSIEQMFFNEFFYNLIPCYIFIFSGIYRYFQLKKIINDTDEQKDYSFLSQIKKMLKFQNDKDISFNIKFNFSMILSFTFLIQYFYVIFMSNDDNWLSDHSKLQLLYFFGVFAWLFSAYLINLEQITNQEQQLLTHRFFWPFSATTSLFYIIQSKSLITPVISLVSLIRLSFEIILTLYAIYQFEPRQDDLQQEDFNEDTPQWVKQFFIYFEYFYSNRTLKPDLNQEEEQIEDINLNVDFQKKNKEQYFLKLLPKRKNIAINKKTINKIVQSEMKVFFQVITKIDNQIFIVEKKYKNFISLEKAINNIYKKGNFPKLKIPRLILIENEDDLIQNRINAAESYLQKLVNNDIFMCPVLLEFLEIEESIKKIYIQYHNYKIKQNLKNQDQQSFQNSESDDGFIDKENQINQNISNIKKQKLDKNLFYFVCKSLDWQRNFTIVKFTFQFSNFAKIPKQNWIMQYTLITIKEFHISLEQKLQRTIPNIQNYLKPIQNQNDINQLNQKSKQLEDYFKAIFQSKDNLCDLLFDFIQYDQIKQKPINNDSPRQSKNEKKFDKDFTVSYEDEQDKLICQQNMKSKGTSRIINYIDFECVIINIIMIQGIEFDDKIEIQYFINLIEFQNNSVKTIIKITKNYNQMHDLHLMILKFYQGIQLNIQTFPQERSLGFRKDPDDLKIEFDRYFKEILKLPKIEKNPQFQDFFSIFKIIPSQKQQIYDFTLKI